MTFNLTPNVRVRRDDEGRIRQLSHPQQPYRPDALELGMMAASGGPARLTPRSLADQYLREVAPVYGFAPATVANFSAAAATTPSQASSELRFKEEKNIADSTTVSY